MILGILPAVGSGLGSMARTGQLERLFTHLGGYADGFERLTYFSYLPDDDALWPPFHEQTDATLVTYPGPAPISVQQALRWPLLQPATFRAQTGFRVMSLLGVVPAIMAYWLWRKPFVVSFGNDYPGIARLHGRPPWKWRWLQRCAERWAAAIFINNRARAEQDHARLPTVQYRPNWVDLERFSPNGRPSATTLLYVGRFVVEKNLLIAAAAAHRLKLPFLCVGDGPLKGDLIRAGAYVRPPQPWELLPDVYRQARCFVLPSYLEGHPKALLEAMACGVPGAVSSTLDGVADLDGLARFDMHSAADCAAAIRRVLAEPEAGPWAREAVTRYDIRTVLPAEVQATIEVLR